MDAIILPASGRVKHSKKTLTMATTPGDAGARTAPPAPCRWAARLATTADGSPIGYGPANLVVKHPFPRHGAGGDVAAHNGETKAVKGPARGSEKREPSAHPEGTWPPASDIQPSAGKPKVPWRCGLRRIPRR